MEDVIIKIGGVTEVTGVTAGQSSQKKTATYGDVAVFFHIYAGMLTLP